MNDTINKTLLLEKLREFADDLEGRYSYYQNLNGKPNTDPRYSRSEHVYNGLAEIVLIANGFEIDPPTLDAEDLTDERNEMLQRFRNSWNGKEYDLVAQILQSEDLADNEDAKRIRVTQAKFTLMNLPKSAFAKAFSRAIGEIAGVFGATHLRDEARSIEQIRSQAKETLDQLSP